MAQHKIMEKKGENPTSLQMLQADKLNTKQLFVYTPSPFPNV